MSVEQTPQYTYQGHLEVYDTQAPRRADGEIGFLMDTLDDILYAGGGTVIHPCSAHANGDLFESHFSYEYLRGETGYLGLAWPLESVSLHVDHTRQLGKAALRQSYKIKIDNSIHQASAGPNRVTSMYYLEEVAGREDIYYGTMIRPNIMNDPSPSDEPMTVYDCDQLYTLLDQVVLAIRRDKHNRTASSI